MWKCFLFCLQVSVDSWWLVTSVFLARIWKGSCLLPGAESSECSKVTQLALSLRQNMIPQFLAWWLNHFTRLALHWIWYENNESIIDVWMYPSPRSLKESSFIGYFFENLFGSKSNMHSLSLHANKLLWNDILHITLAFTINLSIFVCNICRF